MTANFYFNKTCNENCYYCNEGDKTKYKIKSDKELLNSFTNVIDIIQSCPDQNLSAIAVLGGEPGLWSKDLWDGILTTVKQRRLPLIVFTNGAALNLSFLQENPDVDFFWHCSLDLEPIKISDPCKNIGTHQIVVTHENLKKLDAFLALNAQIAFTIDVVQNSFYKKNTEFSEEDWDTLISILLKHNNIDEIKKQSIIKTRDSAIKDEIKIMQDFCQKQSFIQLYDLTEDSIYGCIAAKDRLPITEENIKEHCKKTLFKEMHCGSCYNHTFYYYEQLFMQNKHSL